jgi:hypothetical protein
MERLRLLWLPVMVSLAGLLTACAGGQVEEQNYKVLSEQPPQYHGEDRPQPEGKGVISGMLEGEGAPAASESGGDGAEEAADDGDAGSNAGNGQELGPPVDIPQRRLAGRDTPASPSLEGMDRSHWPRTMIAAADGTVSHYPLYYRDLRRIGDLPLRPRPFLVDRNEAMGRQLHQAMRAPWGGAWFSESNAAAAAVQPLKFGFDTIAMPVRWLLAPPWSEAHTPRRSTP